MDARSEARRPLAVVAGATGYLGRHVVVALHQAGWRVRALARNPSKLEPIREAVDEIFEAEATQTGALDGLCTGADACFSSLGIRQLARAPTFWEVDRDANLALVDEAERAGVRRFVFVSVLGAPERRRRNPLFDARETVVDALFTSSMEATVVRPTGLFNDMDELFGMARRGRVWEFDRGRARVNPIHASDVADRVVDILRAEPMPLEVDLGGPDTFTLHEIGALAFEALGQRPRFTSLPAGLLPILAGLCRPLHPNLSALLDGFHGVTTDGAVGPTAGRRRLGPHFEALAAEIRAAVEAGRSQFPMLGERR